MTESKPKPPIAQEPKHAPAPPAAPKITEVGTSAPNSAGNADVKRRAVPHPETKR